MTTKDIIDNQGYYWQPRILFITNDYCLLIEKYSKIRISVLWFCYVLWFFLFTERKENRVLKGAGGGAVTEKMLTNNLNILSKQKHNLSFCPNLKFSISKSLHPGGVIFWYLKILLFDQTEFIIWNIEGLRHWVAKILGLNKLECVAKILLTENYEHELFIYVKIWPHVDRL